MKDGTRCGDCGERVEDDEVRWTFSTMNRGQRS